MNNLEKYYEQLLNTPSDINEHLPTLRNYASRCQHITEMGVRGVVSTFAFAASKPKTLKAIDLFHPSVWNSSQNLELIENFCKNNFINFEFITGNTLEIEIEETDFLFIDTLHTYPQLKKELELHGNKAKKYIGFHDTTLYEYNDEHNSYTDVFVNGPKKGLWPAIEEFIEKNAHWKLEERRTNNNGLTILRRD